MEQRPLTPHIYLEALRSFQEHSRREVARVKKNLNGLSDDDKASLIWSPDDQVKSMEEAVNTNLAFLEKVADLIQQHSAKLGTDLHGGMLQAPNSKVVQNLLQSFVREWSEEGLEERKECFEKLLTTLHKFLKPQLEESIACGKPPPRVLCPGTQLARMAFEVQSRGYSCEACEARALHYFGSEFVRQMCMQKEAHRIQPFVLNTCNRFEERDHVRVVPIADVDIKEGTLPPVHFGDFVQLYRVAERRATFDGLVTAFALDTSASVFRFVRTAAHVVRPGGIWVNFGPLAYDVEHDEAHGHSIELSWEELRYAVSHFFTVQDDEEFVDSFHAANLKSMMQTQYSCVFFSAIRNDKEAVGISD